MEDYIFAQSDFGASEVARLTGITQDRQRDWRRRGLLPAKAAGAHARFTALAVAQLMVRQNLSRLGVDLAETDEIAALSGFNVLSFGSQIPGAVDFEAGLSEAIIASAAEAINEPVAYRYLAVFYPPISEALADQAGDLASATGGLGPASAFDTLGAIERLSEHLQQFGCAFSWAVVDLAALGLWLAGQAEKPLQTIKAGGKSRTP